MGGRGTVAVLLLVFVFYVIEQYPSFQRLTSFKSVSVSESQRL